MKEKSKEIEIYEITDQLNKLNLSSDEQEISTLLDYDKTSSEEEILGKSFNIPYYDKFIPGNKIHKELAYKEETFKTNFYKVVDGNLYKKYVKKTLQIKNGIQSEHKINKQELKKAFKEDLKNFTYKKVTSGLYNIEDELKQKHEKYKNSSLEKFNGYWSVISHKNGHFKFEKDYFEKHPNFITAKLSYVKDKEIYSKNIALETGGEIVEIDNYSQNYLNHSERRTFRYLEKKILNDKKYIDADKVIIDIHTKLSMCPECFTESKRLINDNHKLAIRVSFDHEYIKYMKNGSTNYYINQKEEISTLHNKNLIQEHIEFVEKLDHKWKWKDGSIIGSGSSLNQYPDLLDKANELSSIFFMASSYVEELIEKALLISGDVEHHCDIL